MAEVSQAKSVMKFLQAIGLLPVREVESARCTKCAGLGTLMQWRPSLLLPSKFFMLKLPCQYCQGTGYAEKLPKGHLEPTKPWPKPLNKVSLPTVLPDGWWILHPGTAVWTQCESFEQAMDKWFEGFNLPRLVKDGKMESIADATLRVKIHLAAAGDPWKYSEGAD